MLSNILFRQVAILLAGLLFCIGTLCAQENAVQITIQEAEQIFLEKNLQLLAEKYSIEKAQAEIVQARVFNNPNFSAGVDILNPDNKKWFDITKSTGQYTFSIEQLIRLGGKRNKEIALANINLTIAENQFYDVLRTLRFSLNSVFYEIYYTLRSLESFDMQISLLEDLQVNYTKLEKDGVVSLNELIRIRSLLYSLKSDKLELQNTFNEQQSQLQMLLQNNTTVFIPQVNTSDFIFQNPNQFGLANLIEKAKTGRVDLQIAKSEVDLSKKEYALQKATTVPDLTIGADYDKRGNFTDNLFCLSVSMDLPFFNRNQGNKRLAKAAVAQSEILFEQKKISIENEVQKIYKNALDAYKVSQSIDTNFENDLQGLLKSITENFRKRNISLLEFTDFYETYRDNILKINQIQNNKAQTMEELRFAVGVSELKTEN